METAKIVADIMKSSDFYMIASLVSMIICVACMIVTEWALKAARQLISDSSRLYDRQVKFDNELREEILEEIRQMK